MTNTTPDPESRPARISRPMPKAEDFTPVIIGNADRSRNGMRSPRSVSHKGMR